MLYLIKIFIKYKILFYNYGVWVVKMVWCWYLVEEMLMEKEKIRFNIRYNLEWICFDYNLEIYKLLIWYIKI